MKSRDATTGVLLLALMVIYLINGGPVPFTSAQPASTEPAQPPSSSPASTSPASSSPASSSPASSATPSTDPARLTKARVSLAALPVKGRAPMTGYTRSAFGAAWTDVNRNGCDQRNDRLKVDLTQASFKPGTRDCVVLTGHLLDPYSGQSSNYRRGVPGHEMDHVVALANMWVTGAATKTLQERTLMANDIDSLQLTTRAMNQQKKAGDAASWLPPNKAYRCTYVIRQIEIKARHGLWVTPPEKAAMEQILAAC